MGCMHASSTVTEYSREIAELRELGFAEGLALSGGLPQHVATTVTRMESGRHGIAVEFLAACRGSRYAVVPLDGDAPDPRVAADWSEVVAEVRRRAPPSDDD